MKESISVTAIFQIFILFVLLFAGIMALTINNSNAFAVKDDIINEIERTRGNYLESPNALADNLKKVMKEASYRTTGKCSNGFQGFDKEGNVTLAGEKSSICIRKCMVNDQTEEQLDADGLKDYWVSDGVSFDGRYFQVETFYQLDIPILGIFNKKRIKGETRIIYDFEK